jgi:PAS domain S-box-containing protein
MQASIHPDEERRLAALRAFDVLDTPRENEFDDIVRVVAAICGTPIAVINLIDQGRQWFKAEVGLGVRETPLPASICAHAILQSDLLVVPDTLNDSRFADNPLVIGHPGLRFYAGALLKTSDDLPLGTVCVLDYKPRGLNEDHQALLKLMASQVMKMLELRRSRAHERAARIDAERLVARNEELVEAVRLSERRLRQTLKDGGLGYWTLDLNGGAWDASANCKMNFGFEVEQPLSFEDWHSATHPDDKDRVSAEWQKTIQTGADYDVTHRIVRRDGSIGTVLVRAQLHQGKRGRAPTLTGITVDLSEQIDVQRQLAESQERLGLALDAVGTIGTWEWDIPGDLVYPDATFVRLCGLDPKSVRGPQPRARLRSNYHPEDLPALDDAIAEALAGGSDYDVEHRVLVDGASVRWLNSKGKVAWDDHGNPVSFRGASIDITERRKAEDHRRLLMNELSHRVRNTLSMVQAIVSQTLRTAPSLLDADKIIFSRLSAMAHAHDILLQESWASANIRAILEGSAQLLGSYGQERFSIEGPDLALNSQYALSFALVAHELGTNAIKYGALSNMDGHVKVTWSIDAVDGDQRLRFQWRETGGPPIGEPGRKGFGSRLIKSSLASVGLVEMSYPSSGFLLSFDAPLSLFGHVGT